MWTGSSRLSVQSVESSGNVASCLPVQLHAGVKEGRTGGDGQRALSIQNCKRENVINWQAEKYRCSPSGNNCSVCTYVIGMNFPIFIWARVSIHNRFLPLRSLGTAREASFPEILRWPSRSAIFSSRKSFETEHRKVHSNYVRGHRTISRCGTSIFFQLVCRP